MRRIIASLLVVAFLFSNTALGAVRGKEVMYMGGTIDIPERVKGRLNTKDKAVLTFKSPQGSFDIPYDQITSLEYGQKAGRRLAVALTLTIWALLSKKRKHYLTIGFEDNEGTPHGVVLQIPKKYTKVFIAIIEARSGMKCDYESEEAKKHVHG
jgi:hypothetical protein